MLELAVIVWWVLIFWEVRSKSIGGDLDANDEGSEQRRIHAVTTPQLHWLLTRAHTNWPRQEGYVHVSESRTPPRIEKKINLELQMND
jgi:hypothetical protein